MIYRKPLKKLKILNPGRIKSKIQLTIIFIILILGKSNIAGLKTKEPRQNIFKKAKVTRYFAQAGVHRQFYYEVPESNKLYESTAIYNGFNLSGGLIYKEVIRYEISYGKSYLNYVTINDIKLNSIEQSSDEIGTDISLFLKYGFSLGLGVEFISLGNRKVYNFEENGSGENNFYIQFPFRYVYNFTNYFGVAISQYFYYNLTPGHSNLIDFGQLVSTIFKTNIGVIFYFN